MTIKLKGKHGYIAVEGPIGVGKTSLAMRLAESLGGGALLESAEENPFLERFYRDPELLALPTQLSFLLQRMRQIQELRQTDLFRPIRVVDFLMEKDRLFARLNLNDDELRLYEQVYACLGAAPPPPELVIYLQAPVEVLLARIARRANSWEKLIEAAYLQRLCDAYTEFFYHYNTAPLLIVNAAEIDPIHNDRDYDLLLQQIGKVRSGRHYFNPLPIAL